jgi:hypothetical protein
MEWSVAFHNWFVEADAIRFLGRKATDRLNYCFFLDRCAGDLEIKTLGTLRDLDRVVKTVAARWSLAFPGFVPSAAVWP